MLGFPMEDEGKEKKKKENYPSLPSNYVTLVQLQERWLKEKERKQREKEQEEEDERRRKLQLQKKLEEEERKRKLGPQRLKGGSGIDYEPGGQNRKPNWPRNRRAMEVSPAKPEESGVVAVVVDTVNVSAEQEQKSEESKEEKKKKKRKKKKKEYQMMKKGMKPRAEEEEVTDGMAQAPRVITEKENALAKRDGESKGARSDFRRRRESGDRTAEIQRRVGDLSINSGMERVKVRAEKEEEEKKEVMAGMAQAPRVITEKENALAKRDGESKGTRSKFWQRRESGDRTAEIQRRVGDLSRNSGMERVKDRPEEEEEEEKEVADGMAQAPRVITEKENAPAKRDGRSMGTKSEFRRKRESGDRTAEIQRRVGDLSRNSGMERVKVRAEKEEEEKKEVMAGMAQDPRVITEKENAPSKRDGGSKGTKSEFRRKKESGDRSAEIQRRVGDLSINSGIERVKVRPEEEDDEKKEVTDGMAQAPRVITEKENALAKRDGGSKGTKSELRRKRESGDRTAEIQRRVGDLSINSGIERANVRATRPNTVVNCGNRQYRGHGQFGGRREVQKQIGAGMVWVRKGELPDGNADGVQSSK